MPPKPFGAKGKKRTVARFNTIAELKDLETIHELLAKSQALRNYFQLDRDKVKELWENSKRENEVCAHRLNNAASELEEKERDHQVEIKVYKQKVRHLLYDQKTSLKQLREESNAALQQAEMAHEKRMAEIAAEKAKITKQVNSGLEGHENNVVDQRDSHQYMINVTKKQNHEKEVARVKAMYESKLATLREDLELRRRAEVNEAEQCRNDHINNLIRQHEEKFKEMKTYYNSITKNNLDIIQSLKDEIATMKKNDEHNESLMYDIERENQNLVAPLQQAEKDVAEMQQKKKQYMQDKQSLHLTRGRLHSLKTDLKKLREEHQGLKDKYHQVYEEREELKACFENSLREAMDTVDERNAALQQRLLEANAKVEERDAQFGGVLRAMNLEPATMTTVSAQIDQELAYKNQVIKDLHFELRKLEKSTNAVMTEYERRCRTVGLPVLVQESFVPALCL